MMKDAYMLPMSESLIFESYTQHIYSNIILEYYASQKDKAEFVLSNCIEDFEMLSDNMNVVQTGKKYHFYKDNKYKERGYAYLYKKCKRQEEIELADFEMNMLSSYAGVNIFISSEKSPNRFVEDDNLFKVGYFNRKTIFAKENKEFILFEPINEVVAGMKLVKESSNITFFIKNTIKGKWKEVYSYQLSNIFDTNECFIGINVDTDYEWYYNKLFLNYIQVYCKYDLENDLMIDYFKDIRKNNQFYSYNEFLEYNHYNYNEIERVCKTSAVKALANFIKNKYYVNLYIDFFYVPETEFYGKTHRFFECLLYGIYKEKCFHIAVSQKGAVRCLQIKRKYLRKAVDRKQRIVTIKFSPNEDIVPVSLQSVVLQLEDYLYGFNSSLRQSAFMGKQNVPFGMKIYNEILCKEKNLNEFCLNPRLSLFLCEHKRLMRDRIYYLIDTLGIELDGKIINLVEDIYEKTYSINKSIVKKNDIVLLREQVDSKLKQICILEKECYQLLIEALNEFVASDLERVIC